jgi:dipeptidyl-peptidase-4
MDTPKENPEGYREANVLNYIKNLKGNLLVIHGTADDVVLWEHSLKLVKESVSNGIQLDYFVYPEHLHNVSGTDRAHLIKKMVTYMKDKLK